MLKRTNLTLLLVLLAAASVSTTFARATQRHAFTRPHFSFLSLTLAVNDREQDGLLGPVRRVKTETSKINVKNGKPFESTRVVLETTTYDNKGNKVDNAYFLAAGGSLTGKESYKYDDKGNMIEMTLQNEDGSLLSKETYSYEFDAVGNWVKMTTSVAVIEGGKLTFEPSEVTYRTIAYYLDETMVAKMSQPAPQPSAPPAPAAMASASPAGSNAQVNGAASQPKPSAAPVNNPAPQGAVSAARKNASAPIVLASLDKASMANPMLLSNNSSAVAGGPIVKGDGEAPLRPVARGPLKPVSGGILNGKALKLPTPAYPENARRARTSGTVEVEVVIDVTGKVISAKALKGPILLQVAAEQAAKQARFSPTMLTGQPVRVSGLITYN
nr:TonB family protein [Acidobacteriota bacterium]